MKITKETEFVTKNFFEIDSVPLSEFTDVSHFKNGATMFAVSFNNKTVISGAIQKETEYKFEGILSANQKNELVKNPLGFNFNKNTNGVYLVKKDFLDYFTKYGQYGQLAKVDDKKELNFNDFISSKPFSEGADDSYEFVQHMSGHNDGHFVLKNKDGKLFMPPFVMDYIAAHLDNGNYHLDELIEHLIKRDDVAFLVEKDWRKEAILRCPLKGDEEGVDKIIRNIPYYNSEENRNETINLIFYPKSEDIEKILNWKENKDNPEIWNVENYIVRVILDCEKFRIKPVAEVEPVVPKRKFKS